jgi:hypothetical protein
VETKDRRALGGWILATLVACAVLAVLDRFVLTEARGWSRGHLAAPVAAIFLLLLFAARGQIRAGVKRFVREPRG